MTDAGQNETLFPGTAGERLRQAREAHDLSVAEIAARTRIPQRHLEAIEGGNYGALPSPTYAVGFVRAYARAVGADEVALARDARIEAAGAVRPQAPYQPYEMADPARTPSRGVVIVAAGLALAVLVLAILWFATNLFHRDDATGFTTEPTAAAAPPATQPAARPAPVTGGQVVLTATDEVWLRVYDADDKTLYLGTMKPGERFEVPPTANAPKINVGRPDKLQVSLNGANVPALGDGSRPIKDVAVDVAAIAARLNAGGPAPATSTPMSTPSPSPTSSTRPPAVRTRPAPEASRRPAARPSPRSTSRRDGPENLLPSAFGNASGTP